jgi:hypothetical protein
MIRLLISSIVFVLLISVMPVHLQSPQSLFDSVPKPLLVATESLPTATQNTLVAWYDNDQFNVTGSITGFEWRSRSGNRSGTR